MPPSKPWKPKGFSKFDGAGAREGLMQKMQYWTNKDFNYEYGVSLGQAINLALEAEDGHGKKNAISNKEFDNVVLSIFRKNLALKNDKRFRDEFKKFYEDRANLNARDLEKQEEIMAQAGGGIEDFGDENHDRPNDGATGEPPAKGQGNLLA